MKNQQLNEDLKKQVEIEKEEKMRAEARAKAEKEIKKRNEIEKGKNTMQGCGCLVFLSFLLSIFIIGSFLDKNNYEKPVLTEAEQRIEMINGQFSGWDGSHVVLTKAIKASMNDPKSYEHVETFYKDWEEYLIVETTYRGKNAYGGLVTNTIRAKVLLSGEVIEILSHY